MVLPKIELNKEQFECLEEIAKNKHKDINYIVSEIIDEYLEQLLDDELLEIADEEMNKIDSGKSTPVPFDEVLAKNGIL